MRRNMRRPGIPADSTRASREDAPPPPTHGHEDRVRLVTAGYLLPDPGYQHLPLTYFVGRSVKVPFQSEDAPLEYMWVSVTGADGDKLVGTLDNEPFMATHLRYGDEVRVSPSEVVMIYLSFMEWRDEVRLLRPKDDFFNRWLGVASGAEFDLLHEAGLSPRQALAWWRDWQPWEGDL